MLHFLAENAANLVIGALLVAAVAGALLKVIRDRKAGGSCGCGCESCPHTSACDKH